MQYRNDPDGQDIVSLVGDMTGIDTTNELEQIARATNEANKKIWSWIFEAYGGWVYDDSNNSDLPTATANLVADQSKYTLPSEALTVRGLEYKDSGGEWHKLMALSEELIRQKFSEEDFQDESAEPRYYTPYAGLVKLHPAPNFSQNSSLRISFDRGATVFAPTDISKTPGFVSQFHEAVAIGASYYIAANKNMNNVQVLQIRWQEAEQDIKEFYSQRFVEEAVPQVKLGNYQFVRNME